MKPIRKLIAIVLTVVMLLTAMPINAFGATKAPAKPATPTFSSTTSTITVNWKKVKNANGYVLYKYNSSTKKYSKVATTTKLSYKVKSLKSGTSYTYALKAYKTVKSKKYYSSYSSKLTATTLPSKPSGLKATVTYNSASLSWSKVNGATGYEVYKYNSSSKKYSKLGATKKLTYKVSSLSENAEYKYAVKAYRTVNKKNYYSSYSSVVSVKTALREITAPENVTVSQVTTSSAVISYNAVPLAEQYVIEYSTDSDFSDSLTILVDSKVNSYSISNLNHQTTYYARVFSARAVGGTIYTSPSSDVVNFSTPFKYTATVSTIDEATTYQTIEGFGASACWWAQRIGRWSDDEALIERADDEALWTPEQTRNALKYLYDAKEGIGLNIYRYNLGTDSYKDSTIVNKWNRTEGFLEAVDDNGSLTYNWNKDKPAQNTLSIAKELAGNDLKLTLFANSPPTQITENGLACCDDKGVDYWAGNGESVYNTRYYNYHQNLPDNENSYKLFAKYLTDVADHFVDEGYNVVDVSPVNEPQTAWCWGFNQDSGRNEMSQEGCHYTPTGMAKIGAYCALAGENKPYKFSMFDSGAADGADENDLNCSSIKYLHELYGYGTRIENNSGKKVAISEINKNYYTNLSLHSYWCTKESKREFADYVATKYPRVKSYTCTEYCQMTNDENTGVWDISSPIPWWDPARNGLTIEYGVQLARVMYEDLTTLNATEWDWWTGCSGGYYPDGLVYVDYQKPDNVQTSKRLWAMGNYSKFIKEGAKRVKVTEAQSDILSSAFKNTDGSLVVVYINQTDNDKNVNLSAGNYSTASTYVTSAECDLVNVDNSRYSLDNSVSIPSQSVVTVVLK